MQGLSETRVHYLNSVWSLASKLENDTLTRSSEHMQFLSLEIPRNDPKLDSMMFMQHNVVQWQDPPDMGFEASPVWHDDAQMIVDDSAKVFLRNILGKSKGQMNELKREVDQKRRDVEKARAIRKAVIEGRDKRDEVEVVRAIFALQGELHEAERKWITAEVEVATITGVVGDISIGAQNHNFKSQTFKIPTNCDLCGERIWGLSAKGFDCKACGYTCHSKCELKVPADCPGEQSKDDKKKLKADRQAAAAVAVPQPPTNGGGPPPGVSELPALSRSGTLNSLSSGYAASANRSVSGTGNRAPPVEAPEDANNSSTASTIKAAPARKNRIVAPPPSAYVSEAPGDIPNGGGRVTKPSEPRGKMIYPYAANGEGEITIDEGVEVVIVDPDGKFTFMLLEKAITNCDTLDGAGWMTVRAHGSTGVVPASYVETLPSTPAAVPDRPDSMYSNSSASVAGSASMTGKRKGPAVAPKRGAKKLHYVEAIYDYTAQSDQEWSMSEGERFVLAKPDPGDGWAEVEKNGQVKSVPASYIQDV